MSFRDKFLGVSKNSTDWSNGNAVAVNERVNDQRLAALRREVKSSFDQGIERLAQSQLSSSVVLQGEIAYQAERLGDQLGGLIQTGSAEISTAVEQGSADIVSTIQRMSDYLGAAFSDIRWAVERQTQATQEAIHALLHEMDNQSRQFFEQGVECYEMGEYELADERFAKALAADPTNHFVYQYLGFMAVAEDQSADAVHNFTLARKFAEHPYHQALAVSHLARSHFATGHLRQAAEFALLATRLHPETAKFWYESAGYHARLGDKKTTLEALRQAIQHDWTYWAVVLSDTDFDVCHDDLQDLLADLRQQEKIKAQCRLNELEQTLVLGRESGLGEQLAAPAATHHSLTQRLLQEENVYIFQDIARAAQTHKQSIFNLITDDLKQRRAVKETALSESGREYNRAWLEAEKPLRSLKDARQYVIYGYRPLQLNAALLCFLFSLVGIALFYGLTPLFGLNNTVAGVPLGVVVCGLIVWTLVLLAQPLHRWLWLHRPRRRYEAQIRALRRDLAPTKDALEKQHQKHRQELLAEIKALTSEILRYEAVLKEAVSVPPEILPPPQAAWERALRVPSHLVHSPQTAYGLSF